MSARANADASVLDGNESVVAKRLANIACKGKYPGNAARDFDRLVRSEFGGKLLQPWYFDIPYKHHRSGEVRMRKHPIFFPHETFSYMAEQFPEAFMARIVGGIDLQIE